MEQKELKYLIHAMNQIMPEYHIGLNDFRNMTPEFTVDFFIRALSYIYKKVTLDKEHPPETIANKCYLYKHINSFLRSFNHANSTKHLIRVSDLRNPGNNTQFIMRIFMNFIMLLHQEVPKVKKRLDDAKKKKSEVEDFKLMVEAQTSKLNNLYIQKHDLLSSIEKAEQKKKQLTNEVKELKELNDSEAKKKFLAEQLEVLVELKKETETLNADIKTKTDNLTKILNIDNLTADLENLKLNLSQKYQQSNELEELMKPKSETIASFTVLIESLENFSKKISVDPPNNTLKKNLAGLVKTETDLENRIKSISKKKKKLENAIKNKKDNNPQKEYLKKLEEIDGDIEEALKEQMKAKALVKVKQDAVDTVAGLENEMRDVKEVIKDYKRQARVVGDGMIERLRKLIGEVDDILNSAGKQTN